MAVPLIIDDTKVANLKAFAEAHPIFMNELIEIAEGRQQPVGDREGYSIDLPINFKVVFSIEEHPQKDGNGTIWFKHMSMSLDIPGRCPNEFAVGMVCQALGFPPLNECHLDLVKDHVIPYVEVIALHE